MPVAYAYVPDLIRDLPHFTFEAPDQVRGVEAG